MFYCYLDCICIIIIILYIFSFLVSCYVACAFVICSLKHLLTYLLTYLKKTTHFAIVSIISNSLEVTYQHAVLWFILACDLYY